MKNFTSPGLVAFLGILLAGCSSLNVNPPKARANTGYVDIRADPPAELSWAIDLYDESAKKFQPGFRDLTPPPGGNVRMAFPPGHHRLRVYVLNRVVDKPAEIAVDIADGKIIPIRVTLTEAGSTLVKTTEPRVGSTPLTQGGRANSISTDQATSYTISVVADPPVAYQLKEKMNYAR
jgi:hypothetical protein